MTYLMFPSIKGKEISFFTCIEVGTRDIFFSLDLNLVVPCYSTNCVSWYSSFTGQGEHPVTVHSVGFSLPLKNVLT